MSYTPLSFRRALSRGLRNLIMTEGVPAINAYLAAKTVASSPATVLQFTDSQIVLGSLGSFAQATLEIDITNEDTSFNGSETFLTVFTSQIVLKIPSVADNAPEDFKMAADAVIDNLRDLFTSPGTYCITPLEDDGVTPCLPAGCFFQDCRFTKAVKSDQGEKDATGVTVLRVWRLFHHAEVNFNLNRPSPLGG